MRLNCAPLPVCWRGVRFIYGASTLNILAPPRRLRQG